MMLARLSVAAVLVLVASASGALADGRVALVIGNSTYAHAGRLPNAENDATDMSAALGRLGFEVTTELDTDRGELTEALRDFTDQSAGADVAVVFYSGHGMEMDGVNYLVPVDARLARDTQVRYETVTLADVLASTEGASLRVVILDACRDNPLARSMQRTVVNRSISRGSLGELDDSSLGNETLVAYAATAGTTAADGRGRNSPYTSALLSHLDEPLEILTLFRRVRAEVLASTGGQQRPHEYQSLLVEHYLGGAPPPPPAEAENLFWQSIAESEDPADFEDYLRQFPDGTFVSLARRRMGDLVDVEAAPGNLEIVVVPGANSVTIVERATAVPTLVEVVDSGRRYAAGDVFRECDECPEMVVLPGGGLALGRYEVTVGEYRAFASATGGGAGDCYGASWRAPGYPQTDRHPVTCVSWDDAQAYVSWLSRRTGSAYRLPTEAEWERAASGSQAGCYEDRTGNSGTCPVDSYGSNAAGMSDMVGNLWEWTSDCWEGNCGRRVLRGGSWGNYAEFLRPGARYWDTAGNRDVSLGFRVSRTLD